jgi:hypothetical protein
VKQPWEQTRVNLAELLPVAAMLLVPWGLWLFLILVINLPTP